MHMMTVKAIADGSGPDITGRTVPMPAGSYHMCREDDRSWFEQRADVFELQPRDETESPVTATRDASGNVVGLRAGGQPIALNADYGRGIAARALAASILDSCRALGNRRKKVYCMAGASGAANGTSWRDAFNTLSAAFAALTNDSVLYTDSTEAAPLAAPADAIATNFARLEWITNAGPNAETWISGKQTGTWTDAGGGVFSIAAATSPYTCGYDVKADNTTGTVTGANLTQPDIAAALLERGVAAADAVAWYGFLEKEAVATATPSEGKWSWLSGVTYINPPGSPVLATVQTTASWSDGRAGVSFTGALTDVYIHGDLTVFYTPADADGAGYSLRFTNATRTVVQGTRSILSGYHSLGFAGTSGINCVMLDHLTTGYMKNGIPLVFYTSGQDLPDAGHYADNCTILAYGLLKTTGGPVELTHRAQTAFSHTGANEQLRGITYSRCLQVDFMGQQMAKFGITLTGALGMISAEDMAETRDVLDPDSWGVRVLDSVALGYAAYPNSRVRWDGCTINRLGYGSNTVDGFSASTNSDGSQQHQWLLTDCILRMGDYKWLLSNINGTAGIDSVFFDGCDILLSGTAATSALIYYAIESPSTVYLRNNLFDATADGLGLITAPATQFNSTTFYGGFTSLGGNRYGPNMSTPVQHSNGTSHKTIAEWLAGTDPLGRDTAL